MLHFLGKIIATVMGHFFPVVVIGGVISVILILLGVSSNSSGPIGLVIAIAFMSRYA
jgi:hypothetical protein